MTFYFCDDFHDNLCSKKPLIEGPGWSVAKTNVYATNLAISGGSSDANLFNFFSVNVKCIFSKKYKGGGILSNCGANQCY